MLRIASGASPALMLASRGFIPSAARRSSMRAIKAGSVMRCHVAVYYPQLKRRWGSGKFPVDNRGFDTALYRAWTLMRCSRS